MLPAWFDEQVKHFKPVVEISWNGTHATAQVGDALYYGTPWEVYEQINIRDAPYDITFNPNLEGHGGSFLWDDMYAWFNTDDNYCMISSTDKDSYFLYENSYQHFLNLDERYQQNPDDALLAYDWLVRHPAFWWRPRNSNDWLLDRGLDSLYVDVSSSNERWVLMEGGGTVRDPGGGNPGEPGSFSHHYHDCRLDVVGTSFDDAYIKYAKAVNKHFDKEGNDREQGSNTQA